MKKSISILMSILMLLMFTITGCAAEQNENIIAADEENITLSLQIDNPIMTINGAETEIDSGRGTVPVIVNDRTLVPVRAIIEAVGGSTEWVAEENTAVLTYNNDEIRLTIDSTNALLNGEENTLDVAPQIINDRIMLPIRFIAESFNFNVDWNGDTKTITIIKSDYENKKSKDEAMILEINGKTYNVVLDNNVTTKDIIDNIPMDLSMVRYAEHEYYSELPFTPTFAEERTPNIKAGHIYYWDGWNAFVINYIDSDITPYNVVHIGEITDKSICDDLISSSDNINISIR